MVAKSLHRSVDLVNSVEKSLVNNQLIKRQDRILLSISGGQDSICLLAILNQFFAQMELNLGLMWCHHLWQTDSFSLMRQITKISYLFQLNSCFAVTPRPVFSELLARNWRQDCSYRICFFYNYYKISLAHSANDKTETILLNLMRGTGVTGLSPLPWEKKNNENHFKKEKPISQFFTFSVFLFIWSPFFFYPKNFKKTTPITTRSFKLNSNLIQMEDLNRFQQILKKESPSFFTLRSNVSEKDVNEINVNLIDITVGNKKKAKSKETFTIKWHSKNELKKKIFVDQLNLNIKHVDKHLNVIKDYNQIPRCSNFIEMINYLQQISFALSAIELKNRISWIIEKTKLKKKRNRLSHRFFSPFTSPSFIEDDKNEGAEVMRTKVIKKKAAFLDTTKDCKHKKKINSKKWFSFVSYTFLKACSTSLEQIQPLNPMHRRCKGVGVDISIGFLEYPFASSTNRFLTNFLDVQPKIAIKSKHFFICKIEDSWSAGWQWSSVNGVKKETGHCIKIEIFKKEAVLFKCIKPTKEIINKNLFSKNISSTIRPLLSFNRFDISKLCIFWQLPVYPDQSNQKLSFLRNRVRKQLLPIIKLFFNSRIENVLLQFAEIFSAEDSYMHQITDKFFKKLSMVIQPLQPSVGQVGQVKRVGQIKQVVKNEINSKVYSQFLPCYPALIKNDEIFLHPRRFKPFTSPFLDTLDSLRRLCNIKEGDSLQLANTRVSQRLLLINQIDQKKVMRNKVIECEIFLCSLRFLKFSIFNGKPNELLKNTSIFVTSSSSLSRKYKKNASPKVIKEKYLHFFPPVESIDRVQALQSIQSVSPVEKVGIIRDYNQIVHTKYMLSLPLFSDLMDRRQLAMSLAKLIDKNKKKQSQKHFKSTTTLVSHLYTNYFLINLIDHDKLILILSWTKLNLIKPETSFPLLPFKIVYKNVDVLHPIKTIPRFSGPMGATFWVWNRRFCLAKRLNKHSKNQKGGALLTTFNKRVNYNTNLLSTPEEKKNTDFFYQNILKSNLFHKKKKGNIFTHNFFLKFDTLETKKKEIYWPLIISFLPTALQRRFVKLFLIKQNWQQVRYSQIEQFLTILKKLSL